MAGDYEATPAASTKILLTRPQNADSTLTVPSVNVKNDYRHRRCSAKRAEAQPLDL
jgi:hypothetical protein